MGRWLKSKIASLSRISGYQKPEIFPGALRMDTNENLALRKSFALGLVREAVRGTDPREYPSYQYDELRNAIAKYLRVEEHCVTMGSGSDQIIDLLLTTFSNGLPTVTVEPTFTFYKDRCNLRSISMKEVALENDFGFDATKLLAGSGASRMCYICSPNNPTGNQFDKEQMVKVVEDFNGLVIVDEAYVEFGRYSMKDLVKKYDNLVVLRTMSKAFGLAGARVGYMVANKKIADLFVQTIQYPYPLSSLSLRAATIALTKYSYVKRIIEVVKKERRRLFEEINSMKNLTAFDSDANFVLFEVGKNFEKIFGDLVKNGVVVRKIGNIGSHKGCLRVTVGTKQMNDKFLKALKVVCR